MEAGIFPRVEFLAVFSKPATYPGFADPPKTVNQIFIDMAASRRRLRFRSWRRFHLSRSSLSVLFLSSLELGILTINLRNVEYSILPVMSELSIVRCDRALGLWIAGTRASSVDGELPWMSSGRAAAVVSTPESRAQAVTDGGFLGLRLKIKQADGG